jgi:transcriptional regulator with XRE-family HTH domain
MSNKAHRTVPLAEGQTLDLDSIPKINLRERLGLNNPESEARMEEIRTDMEVGMALYQARTAAGLTQVELAKLVGTSPSAISRLEDADYQGHSMAMLRKIAKALGKRVELRFVPIDAPHTPEPEWNSEPASASSAAYDTEQAATTLPHAEPVSAE